MEAMRAQAQRSEHEGKQWQALAMQTEEQLHAARLQAGEQTRREVLVRGRHRGIGRCNAGGGGRGEESERHARKTCTQAH